MPTLALFILALSVRPLPVSKCHLPTCTHVLPSGALCDTSALSREGGLLIVGCALITDHPSHSYSVFFSISPASSISFSFSSFSRLIQKFFSLLLIQNLASCASTLYFPVVTFKLWKTQKRNNLDLIFYCNYRKGMVFMKHALEEKARSRVSLSPPPSSVTSGCP